MRSLIRVIITVLPIFLAQISFGKNHCSEIFDSLSLREILVRFPQARLNQEAWELETAGEVFTPRDRLPLAEYVRSREGTYPILMLRTNEILISHRLPDPRAGDSSSYLATHRSLRNMYQGKTGKEPDIIFAGEVRVTLGKVRSLIDMSGSFHFRLSDLGLHAIDAFLILENAIRLDYAKSVLRSMDVIDSQTKIKNFWEQNYQLEPSRRGNAHLTAKEVARFEARCFQSPSCWRTFEVVQQFLIELERAGGFGFYLQRLRESRDPLLNHHMNLIAEIPAEGLLDMMARPQVQRNGWFNRLVNDIPGMRQILAL